MKGILITANVAYATQQTWGSELAEAQRKIKAKYLYNKVHNTESIIDMIKYLAAANEQHNRQEATAPEKSETTNMANLGIEWLQQLAKQPPPGYASTDRDEQNAMAATSGSKISVKKNALSSERTQEIQEGTPSWAPQSNTIDITEPFYVNISQQISCKEKRHQETR